jgi:hypothetical protein
MRNIYLVITLFLVAACPHPQPGPGAPPAPISCGSQAVEACAPEVLPGIYACLDGTGDITSCVMTTVVKPLGCAAYEVVACWVRGEGAKAEHLAQAERQSPMVGIMGPVGPDNWRRAARAKEFLSRTGAKFNGP